MYSLFCLFSFTFYLCVDGAGGVQPRSHQLAAHRVRGQPGSAGPDRRATLEHHGPRGRGVKVSQGE